MKPGKQTRKQKRTFNWAIPLIIVVVLAALAFALRVPLSAALNLPTPTPVSLAYTAAETALATPVTGAVKVIQLDEAKVLRLFSRPDNRSALAGLVMAGDTGRVIGVDASGLWVLVEIKDQKGWAPTAAFEATIAE